MKAGHFAKISIISFLIISFLIKSQAQITPLDSFWKPFLATSDIDRVSRFIFYDSQTVFNYQTITDSISKTVISNKIYKMDENFNKSDSIDLLSLFPDKEICVSMVLNKSKLELLNCHYVSGQKIQDFVATTIDVNNFQIEGTNTFYLLDSIYVYTTAPIMNSDGDWIMTFKKGADSYGSKVGLVKFDKLGTIKKYRTLGNKYDGSGPLIQQPDKSYVLSSTNRVMFLDENLDSTGIYICGSELNDASGTLKKGGISKDSSTVFLGFIHEKAYWDGTNLYSDQHDRLVIVRQNESKRFTFPVNIGYGYSPNFIGRTLTTEDQFVYFGVTYLAVEDTCTYYSVISINKVDSLGNLIWQKKFGTKHRASGSEYHTLPDGRIMMVFAKWYLDPVFGFGLLGTDYYYLIIDQNGNVTTATQPPVIAALRSDFEIYPNPAGDFLKIKNVAHSDKFDVRITDIFGKPIIEQTLFLEKEFDLKLLSPGTYFVQILEKGQLLRTEKVVKQ